MSIRALIIDDEPLARDELAFLLAQCEDVEVVGEADNAETALAACDEHKPDVVFVDLRMPGPDGIALAESLHAKHPDLAVIIVSAHDDGALRAFEAHVLDYLLKPVRLERLQAALCRLKDSSTVTRETEPLRRLALKRKGAYVVVDVDDVVFFEVKDELVWAVTKEDRFALDRTVSTLESQLDPAHFFRSHRGVIVRLDKIAEIEPSGGGTYELVMDHPDGHRLPLARERAKQLRERIPFAG